MHSKNTQNIFNHIKNMWFEKGIYAFHKKKFNEKFNNKKNGGKIYEIFVKNK
jgi:hypothetical protein